MCLGCFAMQFSDNIVMRLGFSTTDIQLPLLQDGWMQFLSYMTFSCFLILSVMMWAYHEPDLAFGSIWAVMKIIA